MHKVPKTKKPEIVYEDLQKHRSSLAQDVETIRKRRVAAEYNLPLFPQFNSVNEYLRDFLIIPKVANREYSTEEQPPDVWQPYILYHCRVLGVDADSIDRLYHRIVSGDLTDNRAFESEAEVTFQQLDLAIELARQQWLAGASVISASKKCADGSANQDGPHGVDTFWLKGTLLKDLSLYQMRLLEKLVSMNGRAVDILDLTGPGMTWENSVDASEGSVGGLRKRLNQIFVDAGVSCHIKTTEHGKKIELRSGVSENTSRSKPTPKKKAVARKKAAKRPGRARDV